MSSDSTSIARQSVFIEDVIEGMKKNPLLRSEMLGTVFWPPLKMKCWEEIEKRLKERTSDQSLQTLTFDGFVDFARSWYAEVGLDTLRMRRIGEDELVNGEWIGGGLRKETAIYKVGDGVEARAYNGPFWLPGEVTKVEEEEVEGGGEGMSR